MVRLTDLPDMTLDFYRGRKITTQQQILIRLTNCKLTSISTQRDMSRNCRSGGSVVDNMLDQKSRDRKIDPPLKPEFSHSLTRESEHNTGPRNSFSGEGGGGGESA